MRSAKGRGPLGEQPVALAARLFAEGPVASAAAFQKRCGLLGAAEHHGRRGHQLSEQGDVVIVAKDLRQRPGGIDPRRELRRPARREQLHLAPMMLHAFAPFMQIFVMAQVEGVLERFAGGAIAAPEALGERAEIVGIDGQTGEGRPQLEQAAHGVRGRAPLEILLGRMPPLVQPGAQRLDRSEARS